MGSPTLKKKKELNYRRGRKEKKCFVCIHFVPDMRFRWDTSGRNQPRCKEIGLNAGRAYRISPNNQCDAFILASDVHLME